VKLLYKSVLLIVSIFVLSSCTKSLGEIERVDDAAKFITLKEGLSKKSKILYRDYLEKQIELDRCLLAEKGIAENVARDMSMRYASSLANGVKMNKHQLYDTPKSIHFTKREINEFLRQFMGVLDLNKIINDKENFNIDEDTNLADKIGVRIYFGQYGNSGNRYGAYKNQFTALLRATIDSLDIPKDYVKEIGGSNQRFVNFNLGDLCPKICPGDNVKRVDNMFPLKKGGGILGCAEYNYDTIKVFNNR